MLNLLACGRLTIICSPNEDFENEIDKLKKENLSLQGKIDEIMSSQQSQKQKDEYTYQLLQDLQESQNIILKQKKHIKLQDKKIHEKEQEIIEYLDKIKQMEESSQKADLQKLEQEAALYKGKAQKASSLLEKMTETSQKLELEAERVRIENGNLKSQMEILKLENQQYRERAQSMAGGQITPVAGEHQLSNQKLVQSSPYQK